MDPFDELYGLEVLEATEEAARGRVRVHDGVLQPAGLVHGGVYASIAESLATRATATDKVVIGLNSTTSFLRPITEGTVHASGRPRHRGRSTWVWEFDITDDSERLCAIVRMTVGIRASPPA